MKLRNRTLIRFIARFLAFSFRTLYRCCRVDVRIHTPLTNPLADTGELRYIYCGWHDGILSHIYSGQPLNSCALTSKHADGEYVAELLEASHIRVIRGSSGRAGAAAMRQMLDATKKYHIVVTTDGPRGPRRKVKPGVIFLASHTGRKIVPLGCSAVSAWRPQGKWTNLLIPKPLTRVYTLTGEPMSVPPNVERSQLRGLCDELQQRMDDIQRQADELAGFEPQEDNSSENPPVSKAA